MEGEWVEASITADGHETTYLGAGRGRPILLLGPDRAAAGGPPIEQVAGGCRVIAPVLPPALRVGADHARFHVWLRGIIDGLGLRRPVVIVRASCGVDRAALATFDADRISGVAWLDEEGGEDVESLLAFLHARGID